MFLKRNSRTLSLKKRNDLDGAVGTEAIAAASERINSKHFKYPESGFVSRIEHSLLYAMVREPDIFPTETVSNAIDEEDFSIYFYVRPKPGTTIREYDVSYAQLTALLALTGEEWPHDSDIPPRLCRKISQAVIRHADQHGLDRKTEIDDLLKPLYNYVIRREAKQSAKILPWLIPALGATVITGNPLPMYAAFMASNIFESRNIDKGATSTANTDRMVESGERAANVEQASLLEETYGPDDETEDVIIDWS
ncbi:hypothetical protein IV203_001143 [Nitzschia inconspicua]|uniref:Uncharacterized protein n=1 Tax=Nitzschia inconspicua TaxID=303405 RepID=A0A9K3PQX0_9STRA|nr:hypothetical protein IV203_001143 [Nitzschia inconspicua]